MTAKRYPFKVASDFIALASRTNDGAYDALWDLATVFSTGVGSEIQYPLSVVVTGGIISSTLLTLLVLPGLYVLLFSNEKSG